MLNYSLNYLISLVRRELSKFILSLFVTWPDSANNKKVNSLLSCIISSCSSIDSKVVRLRNSKESLRKSKSWVKQVMTILGKALSFSRNYLMTLRIFKSPKAKARPFSQFKIMMLRLSRVYFQWYLQTLSVLFA